MCIPALPVAYRGGGGGGGGGSGCSSTPLRLRGMQLINTNIPKFMSIDNVTSSLLHKNALLSFKIAG